jgi:hypothetical protein
MMQETNFNDIRRNYILASILFILFLLYWNKVTIEQLLIFKFNIDWNWAIVSAYWDICILLFIFFLYTLSRYYVYWIDEVKKNRYNQLLLVDIINNFNSQTYEQKKLFLRKISFYKDGSLEKEYENSLWIYIENHNQSWPNIITGSYHATDSMQDIRKYFIPNDIKNLTISKTQIRFSWVVIHFSSINIKRDFWPWFLNLISRKEFSDFQWPLSLLIAIFCILIIKAFYCLYQYMLFCI